MPRSARHGPSQVIVVDGAAYVIDCGTGVAHQLQRSGVPFSALRAVFITHHHSDHNVDLGSLFLLGWSGLREQVTIVAPPPLRSMMAAFIEMNRYDIEVRSGDEGRHHLSTFFTEREIDQGHEGLVFADERVQVRAAIVDHPPVTPAFAYRIDTADRSIVISGDTRPSDALVELARGADVLVHEVIYPPAIATMVQGNNGKSILEHILASHTPAAEVGSLAERAGVETLVLSHLSPPSSDVVPDEVWLKEAQNGYSGRVIVGQDLLAV